MSGPSPLHNEQAATEAGESDRRVGVDALAPPVRMVSFWMAVALPFLHVPLLFRGLTGPTETLTFLGLLALNLVALLVGHPHNSE
ncbi:hypothetical protein G9464_06805 [Halostella sp. JP-L12]|uniref:hypothetical protein n=1 Tax=Halostella TaxID=1843185 RepID=UPI000EF81780|nr:MULTISPECIES: hypothetical protein [Halostella]NHN47306.1 hypothetical protein [Halostella sp. JP-L12]